MVGDDFLSQFGIDEMAKESSDGLNSSNCLDSRLVTTEPILGNRTEKRTNAVHQNTKRCELPKLKPRESTMLNGLHQQQPTLIFPNNGPLFNVKTINTTTPGGTVGHVQELHNKTTANKPAGIPTLVQPLTLHSVPMYVANSEGKVNNFQAKNLFYL